MAKVLTIEEIERQMKLAVRDDYRISYTMDQLKFPFGFKRMNGEELLMRTTLQGKSEEQAQMLPLPQIKENIENWAKSKSYKFDYSIKTDSYTFSK